MKISPVRRRRFRGFTLIELMVVIAIIAALAGVAYPAYMGYQNRSNRTACCSNLRQLGILGSSYAQDHRGIYPCSGMSDDPATKNLDESQGWWVALVPYVFENTADQPEKKTDPVMLPKIFRCPTDERVLLYQGDALAPGTPETVSYASWTNNSANKRNPKSGIQISRGQSISGVPWLTDGIPQKDSSIRNDANFQEFILPVAENRHAGYICVLYVDGTVKEVEDPTFKKVAPGLDPHTR